MNTIRHIKLASLHSVVKKSLELQMVFYCFWHRAQRVHKVLYQAFTKFL